MALGPTRHRAWVLGQASWTRIRVSLGCISGASWRALLQASWGPLERWVGGGRGAKRALEASRGSPKWLLPLSSLFQFRTQPRIRVQSNPRPKAMSMSGAPWAPLGGRPKSQEAPKKVPGRPVGPSEAMHRRYRRPPSPSLSTPASPHFLFAFLALRPFLLFAPPCQPWPAPLRSMREDRTGYQGMPTEFNSRTATARFSTQAATIIAAASTTRSTRIGGGGEATPPPPSGGHLQR